MTNEQMTIGAETVAGLRISWLPGAARVEVRAGLATRPTNARRERVLGHSHATRCPLCGQNLSQRDRLHQSRVVDDLKRRIADERKQFTLGDLQKIPSVIKEFLFFAQPKFRIASARPGSGNTKNIGSVTKIEQLVNGTGPFAALGEDVYDDYWMFYQTRDMAEALKIKRPYINLKTFLEYKNKGIDKLRAHEKEIVKQAEDEPVETEDEAE